MFSPAQELQNRGFRLVEKSLSVGGARILARVNLIEKTVCIDMETVARHAAEQGISVEQMRQQALAHELGHVLHPDLRGRAAEQAAQECVARWQRGRTLA